MAIADGTYEVDPVSRIEGHLGVKVTTVNGVITDAEAHGNLWRGFENFLIGRAANDAITFVQRICGVCPVPHGMTSTYAVDNVLGYSKGHITFAFDGTNGVPPKAVGIRNLVLGMEFLMSSITHFYHLAAPSYIQGPAIPPWTPYFNDLYYGGSGATSMLSNGRAIPEIGADGFSADLWSTVIRSYVVALRVRRLTFEAGALFAGRMPMTSVYIGGGVTFDGTENLNPRLDIFEKLAKEVGLFVIQEYVPIALALSLLYPNYDNTHNVPAGGYGAGLGRYLSWGAFPDLTATGTLALPGGVKTITGVTTADFGPVADKAGVAANFLAPAGTHNVPANLTEDIAHSRYGIAPADEAAYGGPTGVAAYPGAVSRTKPNRGKVGAYTYMKAPRWAGLACEVGPMARMFVANFFQDNVLLSDSLGAYYTAYVKTASGNQGLAPAMVYADIAVALLKAGLATVRNATVATALSLPTTTDFTYAMIVANLGALETLLGTTGAHDTIVAAYTNADTVITGTITTHVLGLRAGKSTMDRLRARAVESLYLIQKILGTYNPSTGVWAGNGWVAALRGETGGTKDVVGSTWRQRAIPAGAVSGWGACEAPRGALMHTISISAGKITKYQCIVPTTWNGSPIVGTEHGAIEAAVIGAPFADQASPTYSIPGTASAVTTGSVGGVEVLRIAQSFDPCIACAIH